MLGAAGRALPASGSRAPAFLAPVEKRIQLDEGADEQVITDLCKLPATTVELRTRSNMLTSEAVDALRHCRHPLVQLRAPFLAAHVERFERLPRAEPLLLLADQDSVSWLQLSRLEPRRWHVRVAGELTETRAGDLGELRNAEVELDLRGRIPSAEELARFRSLSRVSRSVRVGSTAPPEVIASLGALHLEEVVVETRDNEIPAPLLEALAATGLPVCVELTWPVVTRDLVALARVQHLAIEVALGSPQRLPPGFASAFAALAPMETPPLTPEAPHHDLAPLDLH